MVEDIHLCSASATIPSTVAAVFTYTDGAQSPKSGEGVVRDAKFRPNESLDHSYRGPSGKSRRSHDAGRAMMMKLSQVSWCAHRRLYEHCGMGKASEQATPRSSLRCDAGRLLSRIDHEMGLCNSPGDIDVFVAQRYESLEQREFLVRSSGDLNTRARSIRRRPHMNCETFYCQHASKTSNAACK